VPFDLDELLDAADAEPRNPNEEVRLGLVVPAPALSSAMVAELEKRAREEIVPIEFEETDEETGETTTVWA
jgi:hypothetical protein